PLTERDIPIGIVTGGILVSMIPIGLLLFAFGNTAPIAANPGATIVLSIIYTLIAGVVIAAVCGYMAGLIGASNSPISGVGILSVLGISLILAALFPHASGDATTALAAPQAAIISTIAQGVLGGTLDWAMIREGAIIGVVAVAVDEGLKATSGRRLHLPPLAIGMGIYLPLEADLLIPVGAVLGWFYN